MRVNLTPAEIDILEEACACLGEALERDAWPVSVSRAAFNRLRDKLAAAKTPVKGANVAPIEEALIKASGCKVVPLVSGHAQASRRCATVGVTPEQARQVGEWMARQPWLVGPQTLLDVLNKWPQWLSKAIATAPPPELKPGLSGSHEAGRGTPAPGQGAAGGGPTTRLRRGFGNPRPNRVQGDR